MRNKLLLISISLSLIAIGSVFYIQFKKTTPEKVSPLVTPSLPAQSNDQGEVSALVQPIVMKAGEVVTASVVLTTHSVELDNDLAASSFIRYNNGEPVKAISWQGSPPGGHHRSGTLIFPPSSSPINSFQIFLKGIDGVPIRAFSWIVPVKS